MSIQGDKIGEVSLYAEFHLNISRVTLFVSLNLKGKHDDQALLYSDGQRVRVEYDGNEATIVFPNGITGKATAHIPLMASASLSASLEITEKGNPKWSNVFQSQSDNSWTSARFADNAMIACRSCRTTFVYCSSPVTWKDLPREDWAEFMDLWHCHRPGTSTDGPQLDHAIANGRALSIPEVNIATGYIDTYSFIAHSSVCQNVQVSHETRALGNSIRCATCSTEVGVRDDILKGLRLHKWSLSIKTEPSQDWEQSDVQSIVCERILAVIDSQATTKILLRVASDLDRPNDDLLLWVLNPDIRYCASKISSGNPRRAVKVLYRDITISTLEQALKDSNETSIDLPPFVMQQLRSRLIDSNNMLPQSARRSQDWDVGLLDRFETSQGH